MASYFWMNTTTCCAHRLSGAINAPAKKCREITEQVGTRRLIELTANPALTGFTLPKIWWVRRHEPQIWARVRSILLPKDYVRFRLTGARAIDVADASGTLMLDVVNRRWSQPILKISRLDEQLLPKVYESPEITGRTSEEVLAPPDFALAFPSLRAPAIRRLVRSAWASSRPAR